MRVRSHERFSRIENDINRFYEDGTVDLQETALKVVCRALSVVVDNMDAYTRARFEGAKTTLEALLLQRQEELRRLRTIYCDIEQFWDPRRVEFVRQQLGLRSDTLSRDAAEIIRMQRDQLAKAAQAIGGEEMESHKLFVHPDPEKARQGWLRCECGVDRYDAGESTPPICPRAGAKETHA